MNATIYCNSNTYISRYSPTTSHASASKLITSAGGGNNIGKNSIQSALLGFSIPASVRYKKVMKAVLRYYLGTDTSSLLSTGICYTPYVTERSVEEINYGNVYAAGSVGEEFKVNRQIQENLSGIWIEQDITNIYANNVGNGQFIIVISPNMPGTFNDAAPISAYIGGIASGNIAQLIVNCEDVEQIAPTIAYPSNVYVRQGDPVLFSWIYNSLTEAVQAEATIEWKLPNQETYSGVTIQSSAHSYYAEVEFPIGTISWRVKVKNDIGESSEYAYAQFVVIGKPAIPVITDIKNKALTEITWNSSDQCAYEVELFDESGNSVEFKRENSDVTSYKPNMFLKNSSYTIRLRIKNSIDLWSDDSYKTFRINAESPETPTVKFFCKLESVQLDISSEDGTNIAILRAESGKEHEVIAILNDERKFIDNEAKSGVEYSYIVRVYKEGFTDSEKYFAVVQMEGFILRSEDDVINIRLSDEKFQRHTENIDAEMETITYSGRKRPVVERGQSVNRKVSKRGYVTQEEREVLERMQECNNLFYRDSRGNAFPCVITSLRYTGYMDSGYLVDIELIEIDRGEVIVNV